MQQRSTVGAVTGRYDTDSYNLDGSVANVNSLGYIVGYTYTGAGQALGVNNTSDPINFVTQAKYAPHGALTSMNLGTAPISVTNAYNDRLQPILLSATTTSATLFSECFDFHLGVAITQPPCSFSASSAGDNGNVYQVVNNRDLTRTQSFAYDNLNRIVSGQSSGSQWGETFTIDSWGNLTNEGGVSGKTNHEGLNTSAGTNNRLAGFGYDTAGNMTSNGSTQYVYDAENRLVWTNGLNPTPTRYIYDGDGNRVEKCAAASATTACPISGTTGTLYFHGLTGDTQAETDLSGNVLENYIFFNGVRIARRDGATKAVHFYFSDHLGSHGVVENETGTSCEQDIDYYPYGGVENDYCSATGVPQHHKFTGKERDTESGLDMFGARYYGSSLGRFMTPDWAAKPVNVPYAHFGNPQSLNLYSYVQNNPTTMGDPDGHCGEDLCIVEGGAAIYIGGAALLAGTAAVLSTPAGQRSLSTFTSAASQSISDKVSAIKDFFSPKQSQSNPWQGKPGETVQTTRPDGTPQQTRRYGPDGYPETDVDHSPHHGQPDPHAHDIGRPADGSPPTAADRGTGRAVQPGDPQPQQQQQPQTQPQQQVQPQPPPPPPPQQKEPQ